MMIQLTDAVYDGQVVFILQAQSLTPKVQQTNDL